MLNPKTAQLEVKPKDLRPGDLLLVQQHYSGPSDYASRSLGFVPIIIVIAVQDARGLVPKITVISDGEVRVMKALMTDTFVVYRP